MKASEIEIRCSKCGEFATLEDVRQDVIRFYNSSDRAISVGEKESFTEADAKKVQEMELLCEVCQEEKEGS